MQKGNFSPAGFGWQDLYGRFVPNYLPRRQYLRFVIGRREVDILQFCMENPELEDRYQ